MEQIPSPPGSCPETQRTRCLGIASGFGKDYVFRLKKRKLKGHLMAIYSELMRGYRGAVLRGGYQNMDKGCLERLLTIFGIFL